MAFLCVKLLHQTVWPLLSRLQTAAPKEATVVVCSVWCSTLFSERSKQTPERTVHNHITCWGSLLPIKLREWQHKCTAIKKVSSAEIKIKCTSRQKSKVIMYFMFCKITYCTSLVLQSQLSFLFYLSIHIMVLRERVHLYSTSHLSPED